MEYGESSKGRKRYYDCARYTKLTPEQKKARQDRETARRQNLTLEQKQQMNARRRACLTSQKKQELNARRRVLRQSLPPEERQALLDRRKARYINKRNTVCHESIAMQCPELGASLIADPSLSTTPSTITKDDPATLFEDIMDEDTVPELSSSPPAHTSTSMPEFKIRTDGDLQNFINEMMDEDTIPEEDMDEEYYLFAGEGGDNDEVVDPDESVDTYAAGNSAFDPYEYVYSNIPERTHVLKPMTNCEYCGAKKFEYEVKSFCKEVHSSRSLIGE